MTYPERPRVTPKLSIREALVGLNPNDLQARRDLVKSLQKLGFLLLDLDADAEGLKHAERALTICLELAQEQPGNEEVQFELAGARNRVGQAKNNLGATRRRA